MWQMAKPNYIVVYGALIVPAKLLPANYCSALQMRWVMRARDLWRFELDYLPMNP
jgi:hypothetical protein